MWKTILLCASLFLGAAVALAAMARWMEPAALPATVAIGLCLVGVVLILAAPAPDRLEPWQSATPTSHPKGLTPARTLRTTGTPTLRSVEKFF